MKATSGEFRSPEKDTFEEAEQEIVKLRKKYPYKDGWVENDAYIEKTEKGKFVAVRSQRKIR